MARRIIVSRLMGTEPVPDLTAPTAPVISATALSTSSIQVALTGPSTDVGGSGVSSYTLERATDASFTSNLTTTNGIAAASFPLSISGLSASTQYFFRLRSVDNAANVGSFSTTVNATTLTASGGTLLSWDAVPGALGYRVYWGPVQATWAPLEMYPNSQDVGNVTSVTQSALIGLTSGTRRFSIRSYDAGGLGAYSPEITLVVP